MTSLKYLLAILFTLCLGVPAWAHKGSDAYLDVRDNGQGPALTLQLSVALKDLDLLLPLDANADGLVTWAEVQAATPAVLAQLQAHTALEGSSHPACRLQWTYAGLEQRSDGAYLRASSLADCPSDGTLALRYTLLANADSNHRLIATGQIGGHALLATAAPLQPAPLLLRQATPAHSIARTVWDYLQLGMHHLLEGYDHMAFLLALVLPLQLRLGRRDTEHRAERSPWWALLRTITAFTLGHSITLVLATLGWTSASPAWVEPTIAASIAFTALLNLYPVPALRPERLALVFGLVHGYGFAGLLIEAAAPPGLLSWALAGFNLGVEAGQLTAVAAWVLLSQLVVARPWYGRVVVRGGSWLLVALAAYWFWQRVA